MARLKTPAVSGPETPAILQAANNQFVVATRTPANRKALEATAV